MADTATHDPVRSQLGLRALLLSTVGAAGVAFVVLVTVVAPAEYGVDPTGIGKRLGLDTLHNTALSAGVLWRAEGARRSDSATVSIAPGDGVEVKAIMLEGQQLLYRWSTDGGALFLEIHGDPADGGTYSSYETLSSATAGEGGLSAPFDGSHGWYFRNDSADEITVTVESTGYYEMFETKR